MCPTHHLIEYRGQAITEGLGILVPVRPRLGPFPSGVRGLHLPTHAAGERLAQACRGSAGTATDLSTTTWSR